MGYDCTRSRFDDRCGGVAMYEINIPLGADVFALAIKDEKVLEGIAAEVREHPGLYAAQSISL